MPGTPLPPPSSPEITAWPEYEPNTLSAYNVCLQYESKLATSEDRVRLVRLLGYLPLYTPRRTIRSEVAHWIHSRKPRSDLADLGEFFETHVTVAFKKFKGRTPAPTSHPSRSSFEGTRSAMIAEIKEAPRDHANAKNQALIRDNYRCVVTGFLHKKAPADVKAACDPGVGTVYTECAHIISEAAFFGVSPNETDNIERDYSASILAVLKQFGVDIMSFNGPNVHSLPNVITMQKDIHDAFDRLRLVELLEAECKEAADGAVINIYEWVSKVTLDILCETAFGYKADTLHNPNNELSLAYHGLAGIQTATNCFKLMVIMTILPGFSRLLASDWVYFNRKIFDYIPLCNGVSTLVASFYEIRRISKKLLDKKLQEADSVSDQEAKRDVMSVLTSAHKAEERNTPGCYSMSEQMMMDQVLTVLGSGHRTVASGLTWALWLLANHKESQKKLREELEPLMKSRSHPDFRRLKDLKWLDCVVMESLRVMPPVPLTVRIAKETGIVEGIVIPAGTLIYIPILAVNTCTETWGEDAEEFHPERWLNLPKDYHSTYSFLSFFAGPHTCIGKTMAILEMKAILAGLIANFEFEPTHEGQVAKPATGITMRPTDEMPLRMKHIHRS